MQHSLLLQCVMSWLANALHLLQSQLLYVVTMQQAHRDGCRCSLLCCAHYADPSGIVNGHVNDYSGYVALHAIHNTTTCMQPLTLGWVCATEAIIHQSKKAARGVYDLAPQGHCLDLLLGSLLLLQRPIRVWQMPVAPIRDEWRCQVYCSAGHVLNRPVFTLQGQYCPSACQSFQSDSVIACHFCCHAEQQTLHVC